MKQKLLSTVIALVFLLVIFSASADTALQEITLTVSNSGGTPLLLEFRLKDPGMKVRELRFDFSANGRIDYAYVVDEPWPEEEELLVYRGIPHRTAGMAHTIYVEALTEEKPLYWEFETAFADFQWGRDNLSFANDNTFRDTAGPVSRYLISWASQRFGVLDERQEMLLVSLMYRLFRGNIGRCYGFSAAGLYYQANPWILNREYEYAFAMEETDPRVIELIHMVQNDIVYHIFSSGNVSPELDHGPQDLKVQRDLIMEAVREGRPAVLGYLSRNTHHSMTVFGYIYDKGRDRLLLASANNWNRDQADAMHSKDGVIIPLYFHEGSYQIDWLNYTYREEDRLFVIDPLARYNLNRDTFDRMLQEEQNLILQGDQYRVIAEHPLWAYIENEAGAKRGFDGNRSWWGIPGTMFRRFDDIFIFDIPKGHDIVIHIGGGSWNSRREEFTLPSLYKGIPKDGEVEITVLKDLELLDGEVMTIPLGYRE